MHNLDKHNVSNRDSNASQIKNDVEDKKLKSDEEAKQCRSMISALSEEEKEKAARTSYRYFVSSTTSTSEDSKPSKEERDKYAMLMARRHLVAEDGDEKVALEKMRNTIEYRDKMKVDVIRQCFDKQINGSLNDDKKSNYPVENIEDYKHYQEGISKELMSGKLCVRGYSKEGHAIYMGRNRYLEGYDPEWYIQYNIYTLERALACTERVSNGRLEKVVAVIDFGGYSKKSRTPLSLAKELLYCLRDHYPERVVKIFLIDAPTLFHVFWKIIYHFVDKDTKKKITFLDSDEDKTRVLGNFISKDQSMPFMQPEGELESDLDMKAYLYNTPFDFTYEEVH